ncbi:MAG: OmpA family protein [Bacteroidota bacterium]
MINFLRHILRLAFIAGAAFLFAASCASHKNCGEAGAKKKYSGKRYNKSLHERDSLCNLTKVQSERLANANKSYEDMKLQYEALKSNSGSQLNKLSADLGSNQAKLQQREARLRELESILRKQDSMLNMLNNSVKNALMGFSPDELTVEMKNGKVYVYLSDKLLFKSGDATVEAKGREALKKLADVLNKNTDVSIAIEGHTDNVPIKTNIYKDNWDLSAARATNVVRLLTDDYKMDARRLTAAGKGEFSPVADNATVEGKARNRRTEIVLSPKLDELMKLIVERN